MPVPESVIEKLSPFSKTIVKLARSPKLSIRQQRKFLSQRGGAFLPILLSSLLPAVLSLFKK
jgi:hypothetical protein